MGYITTLITVVLGVLSVLFSKQGERSPVKPLGVMLIVLMVVSGGASAYDAYLKAQSSAEQERRLTAENGRIQAQLNKLRLATYSIGSPPKDAVFVLDYSGSEGSSGFSHRLFAGPFPSFGATGKIGTIWFQFPELFVFYGQILADNKHGATVRMMAPPSGALPSAVKNDPWYKEEFAPVYVIGASLKEAIGKTSMRQILSQVQPFHKLAYISLNKPKDQAAVNETVAQLRNIGAYVKFYVDLQTKDKGTCASAIFMQLRMQVEDDPENLAIAFYPDQDKLDFEECEKIPF